MKRIVIIGLLTLSMGVQAQLSRIAGVLERERQMNESATLLWGQRGREAQGYVVAIGQDGYFSLWNDNARQWQVATPAGSIMIDMKLYDPRAVCVQRWTGAKWCIIDTQAHPNKKGPNAQNAYIFFFEYDEVRCVSHRAPIAVGKGKDKTKWGLVTRDPKTGQWSHTVDDVWDSMKIKLSGKDNIFYAQALKPGYATLYALDGTVIAHGAYEELKIEDGQIKYKQDGTWHILRPFNPLPNYTR